MGISKTLPDQRSSNDNEPKTLAEALRLLQEDAKAKGVDKLTMRQINAEIAAYRREKAAKERASNSAG